MKNTNTEYLSFHWGWLHIEKLTKMQQGNLSKENLWNFITGNSKKGQIYFIMNTCEQRHPTQQHLGLESCCSSVSGLYEVWPEPWTSQEWYVSDPSAELFQAKMTGPFSSLTLQPFSWPVYCQRIPEHPETLVEGSQPAKWSIFVWKQKFLAHKIRHLVSLRETLCTLTVCAKCLTSLFNS